ncbi:MAG: hypothetical protein CMA06_02305 [Euryarchaeota archaeon]|nr:hypothetical protein [Euryarchaeota archaeon]|tara:strand:+ start:2222 stop:2440 length:219 start_codon:yes stop_codon:yes gene_type:complete
MLYDTQSRAYLRHANARQLDCMDLIRDGRDMDWSGQNGVFGKMRHGDYVQQLTMLIKNGKGAHRTRALLQSL